MSSNLRLVYTADDVQKNDWLRSAVQNARSCKMPLSDFLSQGHEGTIVILEYSYEENWIRFVFF